jgi:hypothetical protein
VVVVWDRDVCALEAGATRGPLNSAVRRRCRSNEPGKACSEEALANEHLGEASEAQLRQDCPN